VLLWVQRSLELLWLLTIALVPLAFLRVTESPLPLPSPMETAKVAIFRSLVGLMAVLWLVEWGLKGRLPFSDAEGFQGTLLKRWPSSLKGWLSERPTRWIIVAVVFYLSVVLIGTLLSQSLSVSLWGRVPGTDTTAAYTAICNVLFFSVIVTHLKTRPQLLRLLVAIISVGVVVGGYSMLQHYGQDFLRLDSSGGERASSTLGNPIFASSFLLITITISLAFAVQTLVSPVKTAKFWQKAGLWSLILLLQLAGTVFTLSRGPWGGTVATLVVFLILLSIFVGRSALGRAGLVLAAAPVLIGIVVLVPTGLGLYQGKFGDTPVLEQIEGRLTIIRPEGTAGGVGERLEIWSVSRQIITQRPWFEFEESSLSMLRPIVGYGPDLFPAAFMLGSGLVGPQQLPFETTHAHNYFIQHWVELGLLGLVASLGIFILPAVATGWGILRNKDKFSFSQKVLLIGLVSVVAGRFVEQMVGVAKLSDTLLFWVVLALLVCLPVLLPSGVPPASEPDRLPLVRSRRRRDRGRGAVTTPFRDAGIYWRFAIAAVLIVGILGLTWVKNVNNLRALNQVSGLNQAFADGNLNASLAMLDRAIELAPDVYHYRSNLGAVYSAYRSAAAQEPDCSLRAADVTAYEVCLVQKVSDIYAAEVAHSPWRWESRLDSAEATVALFRLTQEGDRAAEAARLYRETATMVPHSWKLRNLLAQMLIAVGDPESALLEIDRSLAITGDSPNSADAILLKGQAYIRLGHAYVGAGQYQQAVESYNEGIRLNPKNALAYNNRGGAYTQLGQYDPAIADYGEALRIDPQYANAYFNRALAYASSGRFAEAWQDVGRASELGADRTILENAINELEASAVEAQVGGQ